MNTQLIYFVIEEKSDFYISFMKNWFGDHLEKQFLIHNDR